MIALVDQGLPRSRACMLSGTARSMLYYRKKARIPGFDPGLEERILSLVKERPSYGTRRVTAMINRQGITAGRNRIRRHMRHLNLVHSTAKRYRKKVPRALVVASPNIMWETDFTSIYIQGEGWVHLTAYIDLCSRKIKGHLVSRMARTAEMIETLDIAVFREFPDLRIRNLALRSDNGSQLTSRKYEDHLRTLGIRHETIHPHTPEEDGHIESYFGRFKEDYIYSREFMSFEEFKNYIDWAVNDYNTVRPHSSLNYLTPEEFESRISRDSGFRNNWIEKQKGRYEHVEFLE